MSTPSVLVKADCRPIAAARAHLFTICRHFLPTSPARPWVRVWTGQRGISGSSDSAASRSSRIDDKTDVGKVTQKNSPSPSSFVPPTRRKTRFPPRDSSLDGWAAASAHKESKPSTIYLGNGIYTTTAPSSVPRSNARVCTSDIGFARVRASLRGATEATAGGKDSHTSIPDTVASHPVVAPLSEPQGAGDLHNAVAVKHDKEAAALTTVEEHPHAVLAPLTTELEQCLIQWKEPASTGRHAWEEALSSFTDDLSARAPDSSTQFNADLQVLYGQHAPSFLRLCQDTSAAPEPGFLEALRGVTLRVMRQIARASGGRRYIALFPPSLALLLCVYGTSGGEVVGEVKRYKQWVRELSHRLVVLQDVLPPGPLAIALQHLQCSPASCRLGDDALSSILKTWKDPLYWQRHTLTSSSAAWPAEAAAASSVSRPLLRYGHLTGAPSSPLAVGVGISGWTAWRLGAVLGCSSLPGHFHLHQIFHTVILPPLRFFLTQDRLGHAQWDEELHAVLRACVRYAVADETVVGPLTRLVAARLPFLSFRELAALLRTLSPSGHSTRVAEYRQRRAGTPPGQAPSQPASHPREALGGTPAYTPLLLAVCQNVAQRCALQLAGPPGSPSSPSLLAENDLVEVLIGLLRVKRLLVFRRGKAVSPLHGEEWALAFSVCSTALLQCVIELPDPASKGIAAAAAALPESSISATSEEQPAEAIDTISSLCAVASPPLCLPTRRALPSATALRLLQAWEASYRRRYIPRALRVSCDISVASSPLPPHPLFPFLLESQLQAMVEQQPSSLPEEVGTLLVVAHALYEVTGDLSSSSREALARLFHQHCEQLRPLAFAKGLQLLLPLRDSNPTSTTLTAAAPLLPTLAPHLTRVAVALDPRQLAQAIACLLHAQCRIMESASPAGSLGIDAISIHRCLSRFTAVDCVRALTLAHSSTLLFYVGRLQRCAAEVQRQGTADPARSALVAGFAGLYRENALAIHALVRHVGKSLLRTLQQDDTATLHSSTATAGRVQLLRALDTTPMLVSGLREVDCLHPHLYARLCRLLYVATVSEKSSPSSSDGADQGSEGEAAGAVLDTESPLIPLHRLLPAFLTIAKLWCGKKQAGSADGTLFKDAVDALRERVLQMRWDAELDHLHSHAELETAIQFWNLFALIQPFDRPVFQVLTHRLWKCVEGVVGQGKGQRSEDEERMTEVELQRQPDEVHAATPTTFTHVLSGVVKALHTSALAVLTLGLLEQSMASEGVGDPLLVQVQTFLPPVLLTLQHRLTSPVKENEDADTALAFLLHPVDLARLLEGFLVLFQHIEACLAAETITEHSLVAWFTQPLTLQLCHRVYDAAQTLFISLFTTEREETPKRSTTDAEEDANNFTDSPSTSPYARFSADVRGLQIVPRYYFASLLIATAHLGLEHPPLAHMCATQLLRPSSSLSKSPLARTAGPVDPSSPPLPSLVTLPIETLVNVFLALCFHFPPGDEDGRTEQLSDRRAFLLPVLTSLWNRTEELTLPLLRALRRCLVSGGGRVFNPLPQKSSGKIDLDFLNRLDEQEAMLLKRESDESSQRLATTTATATLPPSVKEAQGKENKSVEEASFFVRKT